jgi:hypothetical protein
MIMLLVRRCTPDFSGEIRVGKRLIETTIQNGRWEYSAEDGDADVVATLLSHGFVTPESPLAEARKVAPLPAVDVIVVEKEPKPAKPAAPTPSPTAAPKKAEPKPGARKPGPKRGRR